MANTVIALKKSATPTAAPADLANGELAINYADGKLYYKNVTGQIVSISSGGNNFGTVNANNTLVVADTSGDVLTLEPGTNISIVGDAVNDKVTIGLQNDVVIPSTGTFKVAAVGGDEGGEIKLGNAITNSILTGDIVIDVYQNRLRFYESAGTNRGAFINLASAATGVGTDLLAASATDTVARNAAGAAFDKANTANITADLAYNHANAAFNKANSTTYTSNVVISVNDNSNAALKITQTGTGLTLLIEDEADDATPIVVTQTGNFVVGANSALTFNNPNASGGSTFIPRQQSLSTGAAGTSATQAQFVNTTAGPANILAKSRGTNIGDVTIVQTGDILGHIVWQGTDGEKFAAGASIRGIVDAAPTLNSIPTAITFSTQNTATTNLVSERARIESTGNLLLGRTTSTVGQGVRLDVNGGINASAVLINGNPALQNTSGVSFVGNLNFPSGNVGIGVTSPNQLLCVGSGTDATGAPIQKGSVRIGTHSAQSLSSNGGLEFVAATGGSGYGWRLSGIDLGSGNVPFVFESRNNSAAWSERMRIDASGNILIGRTTSTIGQGVKLDVAGGINAASMNISTALTAPNGGTGQSTYAIGDLLYASSTSALTRLAAVATGRSLISKGVGTAPAWGDAPGSLLRAPQILTAASGTYTTPAGCNEIYAELIGGGAAGGGIATATTSTGGPGGGAGSYCAVLATVSPSTGYSYTVGAGGAGVSAAAGGNGGNTTLTIGGTVYRANGGTGGVVASGTTNGGAGGLAAAGQLNVGGGGGVGGVGAALSGQGGASFLGGGAPSVSGGSAGANATANGAGGSGASNGAVGANRVGGNGAAGLIRIWEFA